MSRIPLFVLLEACEACGGMVPPEHVLVLCAALRKHSGLIGLMAIAIASGPVSETEMGAFSDMIRDSLTVEVPCRQ